MSFYEFLVPLWNGNEPLKPLSFIVQKSNRMPLKRMVKELQGNVDVSDSIGRKVREMYRRTPLRNQVSHIGPNGKFALILASPMPINSDTIDFSM